LLIYIHGFNSSPASSKAQLLKAKFATLGRSEEFISPALSHSPAQAAAMLDALATGNPEATLIGSSLGGYYATYLAEKHGLKAVLLNPAVRPYELLVPHVGRQKNFHTGEDYDFTAQHVAELRSLEIDRISPGRYLLIAATGDEVLDYRAAVARYRGCRQIVIDGGDHGLSDFENYAGAVLEYCGVARSTGMH
jgi:predicted esterase YcpF (UPF0227 family)